MQANNFFQKEVSNMNGIIRFMTRYKMCHLRKMIDHNKNTITPPLRSRQSQNKVHRNICPQNRRNRKRHIQTMWIQSRLSFLTRRASSNKALNITPHPRPKEVCGQHCLRLLSTKVAHQTTTMRFLQQQETNGTNWNA